MKFTHLLLFLIVFVFGALAVWSVPEQVFAQGPDTLVPCGIGSGDEYSECTVCHVVELGQRIMNFFVFAAVVVATLLFVNAGVLYVFSPGNPGNISKGHRIFTNTLVGILIILSSWLVIDWVMRALVKDDLIREGGTWGPWNEILCDETRGETGPEAPAPAPPPPVAALPPMVGGFITSAEARRQLTEAGIALRRVSDGPPIAQYVIDDLIAFDRACGGCVTVTSLTGGTHSPSSGHYRGIKADIGNEATSYILGNWTAGTMRGGDYPGRNYIGPGGMVCVKESTHFDCCFRQSDNLCT